ncbi:MAG: hypothetical protein IT457_17595 [Planctomycetes bacterium]|nr:hypothetical protein [Planctomycetota bacterium]
MRLVIAIALVLALAGSAAVQSPCFLTPYGTNLGSGDDVVLPMQPIGFAFPFAGASYTHFHVCTNGFLYLSTNGVPAPGPSQCCDGTPARLVTGSPKICPLFHDLSVIAAQGSFVYRNGTATTCTITWDNVKEYGDNTPFDLQVQLFSNGEIRFAYHGETLVRTPGEALVGFSPGNGAPIPVASDLSSAGASSGSTLFESFDTLTRPFDLAGRVLTFTPSGSDYLWTSAVCLASHRTFGSGCRAVTNSFYELFAPGTMDLAGSCMHLSNAGTSYIASIGNAAYVPPPPTATQLGLLENSERNVNLAQAMPVPGGTTSSLTVNANGFVSVGTVNTSIQEPAAVTFLSMARTVFASWHDYDPSAPGGGRVWFHQSGGIAYVTWDGVFDWLGSAPGSTFQFQFDLATGDVDYVWQSVSAFGNGHLVGFHPGGLSLDGGSLDLSALLPGSITTPVAQSEPLVLHILPGWNGGSPPRLGSNCYLYTEEVPPGALFGATFFGFGNPDVDLTALGMPTCRLYVDVVGQMPFNSMVGQLGTTILAVPLDPTLVGAELLAQSFVFAPAAGLTPLGAITSNGLRMTLGY